MQFHRQQSMVSPQQPTYLPGQQPGQQPTQAVPQNHPQYQVQQCHSEKYTSKVTSVDCVNLSNETIVCGAENDHT